MWSCCQGPFLCENPKINGEAGKRHIFESVHRLTSATVASGRINDSALMKALRMGMKKVCKIQDCSYVNTSH